MQYKIKVVNVNHYHFEDMVYIGRGSPLGNPYTSKESKIAKYKVSSTAEAIEKFESYLINAIKTNDRVIVHELKVIIAFLKENKEIALGCYCKGKHYHLDDTPCHGEVIKKVLLNLLVKNNNV